MLAVSSPSADLALQYRADGKLSGHSDTECVALVLSYFLNPESSWPRYLLRRGQDPRSRSLEGQGQSTEEAARSLQTAQAMEVSNSTALAFQRLRFSLDSPADFTRFGVKTLSTPSSTAWRACLCSNLDS
jgi:hypothetical protein